MMPLSYGTEKSKTAGLFFGVVSVPEGSIPSFLITERLLSLEDV